ncbi:MAG TPA: class I SAM-dependent methyltransferase [Desulfomonilaceae bacterium]|nr:class I SAM-dependent methyltransferase [Desulfomonilaceae bacterium]
MSKGLIKVSEPLYDYILAVSLREPDILKRLREETAPYPHSFMQISPDQGQFMALLIKLIAATRTIELGVYTGYSSLCVALALPPDGKLIACDVNEEWTSMARRYWTEAGVAHKVDLRLAPAMDTLDSLLADGLAGSFDFVFIDADKENYDGYYERSLELLRPGGLIAVDNVLWSGRVLDSDGDDADTASIKAFNSKLLSDDRIFLSMVPIADGLTLALKRSVTAKV